MVQSVEALLAPEAEDAIRSQWHRLADAGLPTEQRRVPAPHHRPHVTLWVGDRVSAAAEEALQRLGVASDLQIVVGPLMYFGPHGRRGGIVVRLVVPSLALLALQQSVMTMCGPGVGGQFHAGRWVPHVTMARRVAPEQIGGIVTALGPGPVADQVDRCGGIRRWDAAARRAWSVAEERPDE